jgi:hypothetical protein
MWVELKHKKSLYAPIFQFHRDPTPLVFLYGSKKYVKCCELGFEIHSYTFNSPKTIMIYEILM